MRTVRQQMIELLSEAEYSALNLSQLLGIPEKEVFDHISHIRHSVVSRNKRLILNPARCIECGYVFKDRSRVTKPGRCPQCKGEHIEDPRYRID
jgi:predicted Zn-ribbon and HTH transcriptional regulator